MVSISASYMIALYLSMQIEGRAKSAAETARPVEKVLSRLTKEADKKSPEIRTSLFHYN